MQYVIQRGGWGGVWWGVRRSAMLLGCKLYGSKCKYKKYDLHKLLSLIPQCVKKKLIDETKCAKKQYSNAFVSGFIGGDIDAENENTVKFVAQHYIAFENSIWHDTHISTSPKFSFAYLENNTNLLFLSSKHWFQWI